MTSPERKISAVWPAGSERASSVDARLASLEDEALHLRAEIAVLQEDIRWLTGAEDDAAEAGWLARGWVRASLLLATVGVVAIVSLPYLLHHEPTGLDRAPDVATRPASAAASTPPAPVKTVAGDPIPARVRESEAARLVSGQDRPIPPAPPRVPREGGRIAATSSAVTAPRTHESSP